MYLSYSIHAVFWAGDSPTDPGGLFYLTSSYGGGSMLDGIPSINDIIGNLAALGDFHAGKSDDKPGAKAIWKGFQRIRDCIHGVRIGINL